MRQGWTGDPDSGLLGLDSPLAGAPGRRAAFLDRDGTLNAAVPDPASGMPESPLSVSDVRLLPGAAAAASGLARAGFALVCVTNQPAAAKGKATVEELLVIHERVLALLARSGVQIEASRICLHHPSGVPGPLRRACECRKPQPGMLLEVAAARGLELGGTWMFGDTDSDVLAGAAAGARTALIEYPGSAHKRSGATHPDVCARDLEDAAARVIASYG